MEDNYHLPLGQLLGQKKFKKKKKKFLKFQHFQKNYHVDLEQTKWPCTLIGSNKVKNIYLNKIIIILYCGQLILEKKKKQQQHYLLKIILITAQTVKVQVTHSLDIVFLPL